MVSVCFYDRMFDSLFRCLYFTANGFDVMEDEVVEVKISNFFLLILLSDLAVLHSFSMEILCVTYSKLCILGTVFTC